MEILLDNPQSEVDIDEYLPQMEALAEHVLVAEGVDSSAELSIIFVDEEEIRELNARYRGEDFSTDVLSFSMLEDSGELVNPDRELPLLLGDVVVCPKIAARHAEKYKRTLAEELYLLVVHGIMHLLGYNHRTTSQVSAMRAREKELLAGFLKSGSGRS
jgi:probable rRNA maturation factor